MSNERIHYLNGLRGILAVIIFIHHFFYVFAPEFIFGGTYDQFVAGQWSLPRILAYSPLNLLYNPGTTINFFFLLSGYVQSYHYFKTEDLLFVQKSFLKRYFRLCIPTLSIVILVYVFHKSGFIHKNFLPKNDLNKGWINSMLPDNLNLWEAIKYGLTNFFDGNSRYYQVLWTMPIELYSSLMLLIILMVTHRVEKKIPFIVFWLFMQLFVLHAYYSALFTTGVLICFLDTRVAKFKSELSYPPVKWLLLITGIYFASYPFTGYEKAARSSMYLLISFFDDFQHVMSYVIGNTLVFLVILNSQRIKNFLSYQFFLFLGNISFMFYLAHFLLLFSFSAWLYHYLDPVFIRPVNLVLTGLISFGVISGVSFLLYKLIDLPVVKYCSMYAQKLLPPNRIP